MSDLIILQEGSLEPAHDGLSEDTEDNLPPAFDIDKFNRGRQFFKTNVVQCLSAMMCSLVCGLSVKNLLDALVTTGVTAKPWNSVMRYINTTVHVLKWHYGNVWNRNSSARKSIQDVRHMHNNARKLMAANSQNNYVEGYSNDTLSGQSNEIVVKERHVSDISVTSEMHVNQYDMSLVQCGFIGIIIMYPRQFGIRCSPADLDDNVYFWRCIGFLLGIRDKNNICVGGYKSAYEICKSIEKEILIPAFHNPPDDFYPMAKAFTDGVNMLLHFNVTSPEHMFILGLDACGTPVPFKIKSSDRFRCYLSKMLVKMHLYLPGYTWLVRKITEIAFRCDAMT